MTPSVKKITASILIALISVLGITYISCNKGSNTATTVTKCVTCLNGGSCYNDTCHCPAGYEGTGCQTFSRQKFINNWTVTEKGTLTGATNNYTVFIQENPTSGDITSVFIENLYDDYFSSVPANAIGDSLYIPSQQINGKSIIGVGYIHAGINGLNTAITLRYQVTDLSTGSVDDFGYNASDGSSPSQWLID